jgi:hypothetical protein
MKLVVFGLNWPFEVGTETFEPGLQNHSEDGSKMVLGNACDIICDRPGDEFCVSDKLGGKLLRGADRSPRVIDKGSHVLTNVIDIVKALVVVLLGFGGGGKHISLCEQTTNSTNEALECSLHFFY